MKGGAAAAECLFRFGRQFRDVELYLQPVREAVLYRELFTVG